MKQALDETNRRREIQDAHNKEHGILHKLLKKLSRISLKLLVRMNLKLFVNTNKDVPEHEQKRLVEELERKWTWLHVIWNLRRQLNCVMKSKFSKLNLL